MSVESNDVARSGLCCREVLQPMNDTAFAQLISKSEQVALNGKYELCKTTSHFDTTARHPDLLGPDSDAVQNLAPQLPG